MEIGHQRIDHMKGLARIDEDIGVATERLELAVACSRFQRADTGGTHRDHPASSRAAGRHRIDHLLRHFQPLTMHMVFFYALHAHRLEGAGTDMQGDIGGLDPGIAQCVQQGLIEMQPGGRSRHGAGSLRVDGLVALAIGGVVRLSI